MKNQAVNIEARSDEVQLIPLVSVILKDLCAGVVSRAGTGRESPSCPICQHGWTLSTSTDGPYLPVVELELKFVAACQTEVLCLMPSKKNQVCH